MAATGHNIQTTADTIAFRDQTTGEASISYDHSTEILSISGANSVNFDVDVDMAAGLDVTGSITMTGATVATQSWVSSQNYLTSETDDQTLNEVLTQGNSSELGIDVGGITGSGDFYVYGNAGGSLFWDKSENTLNITHDSNDAGLEIYTTGSSVPTTHQVKIGRAINQYLGFSVDDASAKIVHRQDETDGTVAYTRSEIWSSSTGEKAWRWYVAANDGTSTSEKMELNGSAELTLGGGSNTITDTKVGQWDSAYSHVSATNNPHSVTALQVGAYTSGEVDTLLAGKSPTAGSTSLTTAGVLTVDRLNMRDLGDYITFYGDDSANHAIAARNSAGSIADDIRINSYGAFYINLDSNNNNSSDANFQIGRHGGSATISDWLFKVDGENGNVGIGDQDPAHKLTVLADNNTTAVGFDIGSNASFNFSANSTSGYVTTFNMDDTGLDIGHSSSSRDLNLKTGGIDRFIIEGGGNIVSKGNTFINDSYLKITAAAPNLIFTVPSGGLDSRIYNDGSGNFIIGHGTNSDTPTERLRIDSSGNVGIGTTSPAEKLHVGGDIRVGNGGSSEYNHVNFTRAGGANVGAIGWHSDNNFYVGGHPSYGPNAGNIVRVYGFGSDIRLGDNINGDVLTVDATNGNVGIGTASPAKKLEVNVGGTSSDGILVVGSLNPHIEAKDSTNSVRTAIASEDSLGKVGTISSTDLKIVTGNSERIRVDTSGNVGIGTASPSSILNINGGTGSLSTGLTFGDGDTGIWESSDDVLRFSTASTTRAIIDSSGNVDIGSVFAFDISTDRLTITNNQNTGGINLSGGNSRIYFGGYRAIEGDQSGGTLYIGEGYGTISLMDDVVVNGNIVTTSASQIIASRKFAALNTSGVMLTDSGGSNGLSIANGGNATFSHDLTVSGNLTVNGTTSTINSTTVQVDDKNIELGTVATPTDTTADGGGITLKGATDKTINWVNSTDAWTFSERISIPAGSATAPSLTFSNDTDTGLFRETSGATELISFSTEGGKRAHISSAGIFSQANVYSGTGSDFRNYGGTWKATTGLTGNGFQFINSIDGTALTISSTGDTVASGSVTATSLIKSGGSSSEFLKADGSVDSSTYLTTGSASSTYLPLAGGTMTGNINLNDDIKVRFGDAQDFELYHSSAGNSYIVNKTGNLEITNTQDDGDISFVSDNGSGGTATYFRVDGGSTNVQFFKDVFLTDNTYLNIGGSFDLRLFHDTSNSYIQAQGTGDLIIQQTVDDGDIIFKSDDGSGGLADYFQLDGSQVQLKVHKNMVFFDSVRARFGNDAELDIYHDGSHSYIRDTGAGNLRIDANDFYVRNGAGTQIKIGGIDNGSVDLYYAGSKKFETASNGINVTGNVIASNNVYAGGANGFVFGSSTSEGEYIYRNGNDIRVHAGGADRLTVDGDAGNVGIGTTSPNGNASKTTLHINSNTNGAAIRLSQSSNSSLIRYDDTDGLQIGTIASKKLSFETGDTTAITIDTDQNVGIGTTSPVSKLHVYQNDAATSTTAGITIEQDGTGDAQLQFLLSSVYRWVQGIDNSDGDKFKIGRGNDWSLGEDITITTSGEVGIGTTSPSAKLEVNGHFAATTKSFIVDNPKTGGKLQYGVVESDQHSVFVRGKNDTNLIELPEEWEWLVDPDSVTVQLTSIGQMQQLFVISQDNKKIKIGGLATSGQYNYTVYGERVDVDKLQKHLK